MAAVGNYEVSVESKNVPNGFHTISMDAPSGKVALSGGVNGAGAFSVASSYPELDGSAWNFDISNNGSAANYDFFVVAAEMG
jgi:hypothetical protein